MFIMTPELDKQLNDFNAFCRIPQHLKADQDEPFNPYPGIHKLATEALADTELSASDAEELAIFFLTEDCTDDPFEFIRSRYNLLSFYAQDCLDKLDQFKVVWPYN